MTIASLILSQVSARSSFGESKTSISPTPAQGFLSYRPDTRLKLFTAVQAGKAALGLNPRPAFRFTSATNPVMLPKPKPRAMGEHLVVPSIGSRDVACAEWPNIRRFEHFL